MKVKPPGLDYFDPDASWWLKLKRADKHLEDVKDELGRYSASKPYGAIRVRQPDQGSNLWRYDLVMTQAPSTDLALIIGDFFHNVRSALDHIVSFHVPPDRQDSSSFPIRTRDPWEKHANGSYVLPDRSRRSFDNAVDGLPPNVIAFIKRIQPYHRGSEAIQDPLAILSRLDNTDKHREITSTLEGLENVSTRVYIRGEDVTEHLHEAGAVLNTRGMIKAGTPVTMFTVADTTLTEAEVDVKISGKPVVAIFVASPEQFWRNPATLEIAMNFVGDYVLLPFLRAIQDSTTPENAPHDASPGSLTSTAEG